MLALFGCYVFGGLGMNIGYHRLLTHRSFACPRWIERSLAILGACCMEESPTVWAAWHRQHHHMADRELDPHSPLASFLWGHIGWLRQFPDLTPAELSAALQEATAAAEKQASRRH